MTIHVLSEKATPAQVSEMLAEYGVMIKIAVDVRKKVLAGGGVMHADCEKLLLDSGSDQDSIWGANWHPAEQRIEFEAIINIRPRQDNRSMRLQSEERRQAVEAVTRQILGGVQ